ncbi:PIN domain-containing protein [Candidatus Woesearchaeota archaeon]|nr:PIN domain-containing protein [Candidatus Woesearchaeota archaeon]
MSELTIYIDTNIYLDYFDGRTDRLRPLGEFAYQLLKRTLECEFKIILSSLVLKEIFYNSYEERINNFLPDFKSKNKIIKITADAKDIKKTRKICKERKTDFNDTLHAVLAHKINADFFVTRNLKDFYKLQDFVHLKLPENL